MSSTAGTPGPDGRDRRPGEEPQLPRKRARGLIAGAILGAIVVVFGFMLLVSQCGREGEDQRTGAPAGPAAVTAAIGLPV